MKHTTENKAPVDAGVCKSVKPVICYPIEIPPLPNVIQYAAP
jgi:hypothetical protein